MSVREPVRARDRGSGQFSDKFGHEDCVIPAQFVQTLNSPSEQLTR